MVKFLDHEADLSLIEEQSMVNNDDSVFEDNNYDDLDTITPTIQEEVLEESDLNLTPDLLQDQNTDSQEESLVSVRYIKYLLFPLAKNNLKCFLFNQIWCRCKSWRPTCGTFTSEKLFIEN